MVREYAPSGTEVFRNQPKFSVFTEYLRQYLTYTLSRFLIFFNVPPKENGEGPNGSGILRTVFVRKFFLHFKFLDTAGTGLYSIPIVSILYNKTRLTLLIP
jgi:hypothetical protein